MNKLDKIKAFCDNPLEESGNDRTVNVAIEHIRYLLDENEELRAKRLLTQDELSLKRKITNRELVIKKLHGEIEEGM